MRSIGVSPACFICAHELPYLFVLARYSVDDSLLCKGVVQRRACIFVNVGVATVEGDPALSPTGNVSMTCLGIGRRVDIVKVASFFAGWLLQDM